MKRPSLAVEGFQSVFTSPSPKKADCSFQNHLLSLSA